MTLIKSISGIRGTIGGKPGNNLTPIDIVSFAAAYTSFITESSSSPATIVIGRDARVSGSMLSGLVTNTILAMGVNVIDLGLSTTPSVEMAVTHLKAQGGIILTASHNPGQWNALKLLNSKGEFISDIEGKKIIELASKADFQFAEVNNLGKLTTHSDGFISSGFIEEHIEKILALPYVNTSLISDANISVVIDPVNSTGGIALPLLLKKLGVKNIHIINGEPTGLFNHNPEPLAENLTEISAEVKKQQADMGIVVDPDVDRLAFICEDGSMFGEEYTLVAVADYLLPIKGGNTVSNLSSSRALSDITVKHGYSYEAAAVGEVNVVAKMKATNAVIGGEGNGGIIVPDLHYGRDALAGLAIFLTYYAGKKQKMTAIRDSLPTYFMSKNKIELTDKMNVDDLLVKIEQAYKNEKINTIDGVKIDLKEGWIHLRKSNTEPIIRIYSEGKTQNAADEMVIEMQKKIKDLSRQTIIVNSPKTNKPKVKLFTSAYKDTKSKLNLHDLMLLEYLIQQSKKAFPLDILKISHHSKKATQTTTTEANISIVKLLQDLNKDHIEVNKNAEDEIKLVIKNDDGPATIKPAIKSKVPS